MSVNNLVKHFPVSGGPAFWKRNSEPVVVHAVDGVSFEIRPKESFGLVGESGCGKTTMAKIMARLLRPTSGEVVFSNADIFRARGDELKSIRRDISFVFQNPLSSMNPRWKIADILALPYRIHKITPKNQIVNRVRELLSDVELSPPERYMDRYPHELSGGERQRVVIARALALKPKFVIADEPVASLDISVRGKVLNMMKNLQSQFGLTYLIITHDLNVLHAMCDRVAVMYLGKVVEIGPVDEIFSDPRHPYTKALLRSRMIANPVQTRARPITALEGEVPSPLHPPIGCRFNTRCPSRVESCFKEEPRLAPVGSDHDAACPVLN
ncbi:MAG: ABC transporter ATP-binding protein [Thaumarchaeota archaeon]|nr:ABC transporter ATP-binding protein [Nitrososphaerota archaeon]